MISPLFVGLILGVGGFAVLWVVHFLWFRFFPPPDRPGALKFLFFVFFSFIGVVGVMIGLSGKAPVFQYNVFEKSLVAIGVVIFSFVFFWSFYAGIEHSIRVRIFLELYRRADGQMSYEELLEIYPPEYGTRHRLHQLETAAYIKSLGDGVYVLTPKGVRMATISKSFKDFFRIGLGG